jgi:tetratricopeptide (TPR) repeat protein
MKCVYAKLVALILSISFLVIVSNGQEPQTAENYFKLSRIHFYKGEMDAALNKINKAIEIDPDYFDAYALRAAIKNKLKDTEGVLLDYNKIIELNASAPGIEVVYINRSAIFLQKGEIEKALQDADKAVSINSKSAQIYIARAAARHLKGEAEGALADYENAIRLNPGIAAAYLGRAYFRYQKNDFDAALADYNKAGELSPNYANLYVSRGVVSGLKGDFTSAAADIKKGALLNPKSISDNPQGSFISPFIELNQFLAKNSANARAYLVRGIIYKLLKKEKEADNDFNKAITIDPKLKSEIQTIIKEVK